MNTLKILVIGSEIDSETIGKIKTMIHGRSADLIIVDEFTVKDLFSPTDAPFDLVGESMELFCEDYKVEEEDIPVRKSYERRLW